MGKPKPSTGKRILWWLVFTVAVALLVLFTTRFDDGAISAKYAKPFESKSKEMSDDGEQSAPPSQFKPAGMRESGIKKLQGNRYETY